MRRLLSYLLLWLLLLTSVASAREFLPREFPKRLKGDHFVVYYTTKGEDGITPTEAENYLKSAEGIYKRLVTEGGMRPPRVEPVPLVVMADRPSLGGAVIRRDLGYDLWLQMNPRQSKSFTAEAVMAHEFFHVLQAGYTRTNLEPGWAIEGTAAIAPIYALKGYKPDGADMGFLSAYWTTSEHPLKEEVYPVSLFWYWLADQYGGVKFLDRLLTWSEHLGWERATQLAAIEGGAPDSATFDTLWRSFVLAMAGGKMPEGYQSEAWFDSARLYWSDRETKLDRGSRNRGLDAAGRLYSFWDPLNLQPYTFTTVQLDFFGRETAELVVTGDSGSVEAYLIKPGPTMAAAMDSYTNRPSHGKPGPVPSDPETAGVLLEFGKPVRLEAKPGERLLLLLMRLGDWGDGSYAVQMRPATTGTAEPVWQTLPKIARTANSPASPPVLTPTELASLRAGRYLTATAPIYADPVQNANVLAGEWGSTAATLNEKPITLALPPTRDGMTGLFPAREIIRLLGGSVVGNRFVLGEAWTEVSPGASEMKTLEGTFRLNTPARVSGNELLVPGSLFTSLDAYFVVDEKGYQIAVPAGK